MAKLQKHKTFNFTVKLGQIKDMAKAFSRADDGSYIRLNLPVTDGRSLVYVSLFGYKNSTFKTQFVYSDGEKNTYKTEEVRWEDRFNQDLIDKLSPFKKLVLSTQEGERQEFMCAYDFIEAVQKAMLAGKLINDTLYIRGEYKCSVYKGKQQRNFEVQSIMTSKSDKLFMGGEMSFVFRDEALDIESGKSKKQVYVDGYVQDYDKGVRGDQFYPQVFVMDYSHFDTLEPEAKEAEIKKFGFMKQCLMKKSGIHEFGFVVEFVSGSLEKELSEADLTDFEKMCLQNGYSMEDIKKARGMKKDYTNEIRLISPLLAKFPNGTVAHDTLTPADLIFKEAVTFVTPEQIDQEDSQQTIIISADDLPF